MIVREKLQFPSGSATAQLIALLHGETLRDDGHSDKQHELDAEGSDTSNDSYNYAQAHAESPNHTHTRSSADETRPLLRRSETERERSVKVKSGWRTISTTFAASSAIAVRHSYHLHGVLAFSDKSRFALPSLLSSLHLHSQWSMLCRFSIHLCPAMTPQQSGAGTRHHPLAMCE
jgi:uncharacterized oligopeptide transporter (OPT) family protein